MFQLPMKLLEVSSSGTPADVKLDGSIVDPFNSERLLPSSPTTCTIITCVDCWMQGGQEGQEGRMSPLLIG